MRSYARASKLRKQNPKSHRQWRLINDDLNDNGHRPGQNRSKYVKRRFALLGAVLASLVALALWQHRVAESPHAALPVAALPHAASAATAPSNPEPEVIGVDGEVFRESESFKWMPLPQGHAFERRELSNLAALDTEMPAELRAHLAEKLAAMPCESQRLWLFRRPGSPAQLIQSDCARPWIKPGPPPRVVANYNFRAMWIWDATGLHDVPALAQYFGFMYESGSVVGVTDINGNGQLELWLSGTTCEPGEDDDSGDYCQGLWIVEVSGRRIRVLDPKSLVTASTSLP